MSFKKLTTDLIEDEVLFLGNEAIARGVIEAGAQVVAAYPGTPSSEIVASLAKAVKETGQHVEWSTNEKVAFECAAGASFLGCRAFTSMKNVGINVAMDTLMVVNIIGIEGGFVFLVADDPNCWSTQNEQDSRLLAHVAEVPCLEPSSVQEAKDMTVYAYELSEKIGRAVMLRTVTRLNHSRAFIKRGPLRKNKATPSYHNQKSSFPALPQHKTLHKEISRWQEVLSDCPFNRMETKKGSRVGIITAGNVTNYVREAIASLQLESDISLLKIGVMNPLPDDLIKSFLNKHETVLVFEEIEPFIENHAKTLCCNLTSKPRLIGKLSGDLEIPGELTTERVLKEIAKVFESSVETSSVPLYDVQNDLLLNREPVLCAGCPHMGTFYAIRKALKKQKVRGLVSGDIGCSGLGLFPNYNLFDSHLCMGASIGIGNGYAASGYSGSIICVLGDSTFFHSGVPALVDAVINKHKITVIILDNAIIAMTGHQTSPLTGITASGEPTKKIDLPKFVKACGVDHMAVADPFLVDELADAIQSAISFDGPSVVIAKGECAIIAGRKRAARRESWYIDEERCNACGLCVNLLCCPALNKSKDSYFIDLANCAACGICAQVCKRKAIKKKAVRE